MEDWKPFFKALDEWIEEQCRMVLICFVIAVGLVLALSGLHIVIKDLQGSAVEAGQKTQIEKGLDMGLNFCGPKKKCGIKTRLGIQHWHELYGPWCWKYQKTDYIGCLSRIHFESRGNPWSHTKDTLLEEAGLTSVSKRTAFELKKLGYGGDPCGDPEWSIFASGYEKMTRKKHMMEGDCPGGDAACWSKWVPLQWEQNRVEAEMFMSVAGSINSGKLKKLLKIANKEKKGKLFAHEHTYWQFVKWLRVKKDPWMKLTLEPLKVDMWRFFFRFMRSSYNGWRLRSEFFPPLGYEYKKGKEVPIPNYCWGETPYYLPKVDIPIPDDGTVTMLLAPKPLYKIPKSSEWRDRCVFYGDKKAWKRIWSEPKRNDKWKRAGFKYRWDGKPIKVKRGEKKYKTQWEYEAAYLAWIDEMQEQRLLPSDEEFVLWREDMKAEGCELQYIASKDKLKKFKKKKKKKK